jgi:hypothetical protein
VYKGIILGATLALTGALVGSAGAQTTTPTTPASGAGSMVLQLTGTLADPTMCGSQIDPTTKVVSANLGYAGPKEFTKLNYPVVLGDYLEYEVLIPASSTLHGAAVDGDLTGAKSGTIRDAAFAEDQNGLYAHAGTDFDILALRTVPQVDSTGKVTNVPMWGTDQWYKRDIDLSKLSVPAKAGTPSMLTDLFLAVDEHDSTHLNDVCPVDPKNPNFTALFRNINIKNHDAMGKEVIKMAIFNGEAMLPDGKTSDALTGDGKTTGTVGVIAYTGSEAVAPASNTPFVSANQIAQIVAATPAQTPATGTGTTPATGTGTTPATGTGTTPATTP